MINCFTWTLIVANAVVAVPIAVLALECLVAVWPRRARKITVPTRPPLWVLIPAHDEEAAISATLRSVQTQLTEHDAICVVADNCQDATARLARSLGAEVVERYDETHRGKGYALQAGVDHLRSQVRPVVVIIDADCSLEPDALTHLSQVAHATGLPIQAKYLMACPPLASPRDVISRFAVVVKNLVRPVGLARLGGPALLTGSGMAFPWELLAHRPLATGHIVEDMQLGFDLLLEGKPAQLLPEAGIQGSLAESGGAALTQRTRWEHGHMHVMTTQLPRMLLAVVRRPRWVISIAALDLCVPPLSFLVAIWGFLLLLDAAWHVLFLQSRPLQIALVAGGALSLGIVSGWWRYARHETSLWSLALVPFYIVAKLPIYLKFLLFRRERKWIRTTRGDNRYVES